jgi:hypothetical protein
VFGQPFFLFFCLFGGEESVLSICVCAVARSRGCVSGVSRCVGCGAIVFV